MTQEQKDLLMAKMMRQGIRTYKDLCFKTGVKPSTFSRKMNGQTPWCSNEMKVISQVLRLTPTETMILFLP